MNLDDFRCKHGKLHEVKCAECEAEEQNETKEETQDYPCPGCNLPVPMPKDWDGQDENEALCNACYLLKEEEQN